MKLDEESRKILRIITQYGVFECLVLPQGIKPATDIFQGRMASLFYDAPKPPPVYLDDILHPTKGTFGTHLVELDDTLTRLEEGGLQVNAEKSNWAAKELEFLGFWVTTEGYRPTAKRVEAILNIGQPTNPKQVRGFVGMVNFIKNHIPGRAALMKPLTDLTKKGVKFVWTEEHTNSFNKLKAAIAHSVMLGYPDINKLFTHFTQMQVIMQLVDWLHMMKRSCCAIQ